MVSDKQINDALLSLDELAYEQFREVPDVAGSIAFQTLADRLQKKEPMKHLEGTLKPMDCGAELQEVIEELRGAFSHDVRPGNDSLRRWHDRIRAVQTHIGIYGPNIHDYKKELEMDRRNHIGNIQASQFPIAGAGGDANYQQTGGALLNGRPSQITNLPPLDPCGPPLKTLVAEYLMDAYRQDSDIPFSTLHDIMTNFLSWEENRRTPPAITTRPGDSLIQQGVIPINPAHGQVMWSESTKTP